MDTKELKVRLRHNEVVHCATNAEACRVLEQAHKLGLRWQDKDYYSNSLYHLHKDETCYNLLEGDFDHRINYVNQPHITIITATEWLNRHNIFIVGQPVDCGYYEVAGDWCTAFYLSHNLTVAEGDCRAYQDGLMYKTRLWDYVKTPYKSWSSIYVEAECPDMKIEVNGNVVAAEELPIEVLVTFNKVYQEKE